MPATELRRALAELPGVSAPILNALIMRRRRLRRDREFAGLRVLARRGSREGHQLDDFLDKNRIPHRLIEFESERRVLGPFHLTTLIANAHHTAGLRASPFITPSAQVAGLLRPLGARDETNYFDLTIVGLSTGLAAAVTPRPKD